MANRPLPQAMDVQSNARSSTAPLLTILDTRNPTANDTNYVVTQRWVNSNELKEWFLLDFSNQVTISNPYGLTVANWILIGGGGNSVQEVTTDSGGPIFFDDSDILNLTGSVVAAGAIPFQTVGDDITNSASFQIQLAQAIASSNIDNVGLSAYDSSQFIVDANGFVQIDTSIFSVTITVDSGAVTGNAFDFFAQSGSANCGATVKFNASSATEMDLVVSDVDLNTIMGLGAATGSATLGQNNTGFGASVFANIADGTFSTAFGVGCLGKNAYFGTQNTAGGYQCLWSATSANNNTGWGSLCLNALLSGENNSCLGQGSGFQLTTGSTNLLLGTAAGYLYTSSESSNICLNSLGVVGESNTLRIGAATGTGTGQLNTAFICGIFGATVTGSAVLCDSNDQLGTVVSSKRYKENITDLSDEVSILSLRPVEFNYVSDKNKTKKYGLISEEVEKDFPYLCIYNKEKQPESVAYHEIPVLLLKEFQRLHKRIEELEKKIA